MDQPDKHPLTVRPAAHADFLEALELVFAHIPSEDRQRHVAEAVALSAGQPPDGLWTAYRGDLLVAAMFAQIAPGNSVSVAPPRVIAGQPPELAARMLQQVAIHWQRAGVKLAQALLEDDHGPDADLLIRGGFRHVSNLLYLVSLSSAFPTEPPVSPLEFDAFDPNNPQRLIRLIERTYQGSLDCPEVDGVRGTQDVLAGYQANGVFDRSRWVIAHDSADVGCVLLTDHPRSNQWELIYMGVVPEARGRGYGVAIARQAQWMTRLAGRDRLVLAVDAANDPAIGMYAAAGFIAWDHRSVFVRIS